MRLIDADDALRKMESVMDMQELYLPVHFKEWVIDECPTVDAVPVVRCKDCSHFMSEGCLVVRSNKFAFPNGFCYWGERRTDEQT